MLERYDIINVEGEGLSFLFTFSSDSSAGERDRFRARMDPKMKVEPHEYFDDHNKIWMVTYVLGDKSELETHGLKIRVGHLMSSLGYETVKKEGSSTWIDPDPSSDTVAC